MNDPASEITRTRTSPGRGSPVRSRSDSGTRSAPPVFTPGEIVGERFRVVRMIGQGGMGQVFEAEDLELGTPVALKAIRPELSWQKRSVERFKREVHLARRVTHPNVCRIFDLFQHRDSSASWGRGGRPILFLTMELLRGETLAQRLRRAGPLGDAEALPLVREMAAALDAAHEAGVIHRDFKSSNVLLVDPEESPGGRPPREGSGERSRPRVVVTDFGLAQETAEEAPSQEGAAAPGGGTPAYVAPEVAAGEKATAAADVYSFGVVVYEMLTGVLPFRAATLQESARLRLGKDPPAPRLHRPELDPRWEAAVLRCLRRRAGERFRRAGELAELLAGEERPEPGIRVAVGAAAAVVCTVLLALAIFSRTPAGEAPAADSTQAAGLPVSGEGYRPYAWGMERFRRHEFLEARDQLEQAAEKEPESARVHLALASSLSAQGWDTKAAEVARHAFELAATLPPEERLLIEGGYREIVRDWPRARQIYQELWSRLPDEAEHGLRLAAVEAASGEPATALATIEELRHRVRRASGGPYLEARVDLTEAEAARTLGTLKRQLEAAGRAAAAAEALGTDVLLAEARLLEAEALHGLGHRAEALAAVAQVREIYEERGDRAGKARALLNLATVVRGLRAEDAGLGLSYRDALGIFDEIGDLRARARTLVFLARETEEERQAEKMLGEALDLAREIGDRLAEAEALNGAAIWASFTDFPRSVELFEEAAEKARQGGNHTLRSGFLSNLAGQLLHRDPVRSVSLFEKALTSARRGGSLYALGMALAKSAAPLADQGRFDLAEPRYREALAAGHEIESPLILAQASEGLGYVHLQRGQSHEARRFFEKAAEHWRAHGVLSNVLILRFMVAELLGGVAGFEAELRELAAENPEWIPLPLARIRLAQEKVREAREILQPLLDRADFSRGTFSYRHSVLMLSSRIDVASGNLGQARRTLEALVAEGETKRGFVSLRFESRLALGRVLLALGDENAGRARLASLAEETRALGYVRIADLAEEALSAPRVLPSHPGQPR